MISDRTQLLDLHGINNKHANAYGGKNLVNFKIEVEKAKMGLL